MRRLMRLRRTAFPTMRAAIANPRRGTGAPVLRANIAKKASAERRASRYTRSNSDFCRRRCAGLNCRAGDEATKQASASEVARTRAHRSDSETLATFRACLLYTSDAADERSSVDLGGRRIIK